MSKFAQAFKEAHMWMWAFIKEKGYCFTSFIHRTSHSQASVLQVLLDDLLYSRPKFHAPLKCHDKRACTVFELDSLTPRAFWNWLWQMQARILQQFSSLPFNKVVIHYPLFSFLQTLVWFPSLLFFRKLLFCLFLFKGRIGSSPTTFFLNIFQGIILIWS